MKQIWSDMGGKLGVGLISAGFLLIFLGWNGAASVDRSQAQFPYLLSGGIAGMSLVICGIGLIVVQNQREDRAALQQTVRELRDAIAEAGLAAPVGETRKEFSLPAKRPTPTPSLPSVPEIHDEFADTGVIEVLEPEIDIEELPASPEPRRAEKTTDRPRKKPRRVKKSSARRKLTAD